MPPEAPSDAHVPEGAAFLNLVWGQEDACQRETDGRLPAMGKKAPACLGQVGTVLSLLDRMASCWWACQGGDHVIEYLCGRVASTGRAALRLMRFGFYDESLVLSRSIGEIANLFLLFQEDRHAFGEWKVASRGDRLREFSPVKVRLRLEELGTAPPISQERYTLLSERASHAHPATKPQAHNLLHLPMAGATFQEEGLLVCLNELAVALSLATAFGCLNLDVEKDFKHRIFASAEHLAQQIGGAAITEIDEYHRHVLANPAAREAIERAADDFKRLQAERRHRFDGRDAV